MLLLGHVLMLLHLFWSWSKRVTGVGRLRDAADQRASSYPDDPPVPADTDSRQDPPRVNMPGLRVRTLRDRRAASEDQQQLYNGNQLNFEPERKDQIDDRADTPQ